MGLVLASALAAQSVAKLQLSSPYVHGWTPQSVCHPPCPHMPPCKPPICALSPFAPPPCRTWFDGAVGSLEGYLRPGCVHLTAQALLTDFAAAQLGQPPAQQQPQPQAEEQPQAERQAQQQVQQQASDLQTQPEAAIPAAGEGEQGAQQKPPCCSQPKCDAEAAPKPAAAASPSAPAAAALAGCCGRKRAAEAPAQPAGVPASAVRRVVQQMLASGGPSEALLCRWHERRGSMVGLLAPQQPSVKTSIHC